MKIYVLLGLLLCGLTAINAATDKVVCYFGSSSSYRNGAGKYSVENIDPKLCTHINYIGIGLTTSGNIRIFDQWNDVTNKGFQKFISLKQKNPAVKLLVTLGGKEENSADYSYVMSFASVRSVFITSILNFLKQYKFDGLDLDWEYPVLRGGNPDDRVNFVTILRELKSKFLTEGFLLSITVAPTSDYFRSSYDIPSMAPYVDYVNVMTYDFHAYFDGKTGLTGPLYAGPADVSGSQKLLNVENSITAWISNGMSASKIVLGISATANTFTLASDRLTKIGDRSVGPGNSGPYTMTAGVLSYLEVCEKLKTGTYTTAWSSEQQSPYAYSYKQWMTYENIASVSVKVKLAKAKNLGGVMLWSIDSDDANDICGEGTHALLKTIYNEIFSEIYPQTTPITTPTTPTIPTSTKTTPITTSTIKTTPTTPATTQTTATTTRPATTQTTPTTTRPTTNRPTTPTTTSVAPGAYPTKCPPSGYFRDPYDCAVFYQCVPGGIFYQNWKFTCSNGLVFDTRSNTCNYRVNVKC